MDRTIRRYGREEPLKRRKAYLAAQDTRLRIIFRTSFQRSTESDFHFWDLHTIKCKLGSDKMKSCMR